jgi:TonB family protein
VAGIILPNTSPAKLQQRKDIGEHGTVEIKMNISESGKVSKVRILKSFNTQLDPILIKAIRKGPRWKSTII